MTITLNPDPEFVRIFIFWLILLLSSIGVIGLLFGNKKEI